MGAVFSRTEAWLDTWRALEARAAAAASSAIERAPTSEVAVLRAALGALPAGACIQIGNSLPIRAIDHVPGGGRAVRVLSQRGAAGIEGLVAFLHPRSCHGVLVELIESPGGPAWTALRY
jgi:2-succinyl-5-enolpyruvyl-6-hydroxy-3-cyclohexene-1-carboxylate synthase